MNINTPEEMERAYGMHKARLGPLFNRKTIYLPEGVREPNNFFKRAVSGALALLMAGYIGLAPAKASAHMIGPTHVYQLGPSVVQPWSVKATEDNPYKPEGDTNGNIIGAAMFIKYPNKKSPLFNNPTYQDVAKRNGDFVGPNFILLFFKTDKDPSVRTMSQLTETGDIEIYST